MEWIQRALSDCPSGSAAEILDSTQWKLRVMAKRGEIKRRKTGTGRDRYDVWDYLKRTGKIEA